MTSTSLAIHAVVRQILGSLGLATGIKQTTWRIVIRSVSRKTAVWLWIIFQPMDCATGTPRSAQIQNTTATMGGHIGNVSTVRGAKLLGGASDHPIPFISLLQL